MSSGNEPSAIDSGAETGYALGALFGMILFNLALVAVALIIRRVTRPKTSGQGNAMPLQDGKFNRKGSTAVDGTETGEVAVTMGGTQASVVPPPSHHDNGGFVDVDLGENDPDTDAVYETPDKSEAAKDDNNYSALSDVHVNVKGSSYVKYDNVTEESKSTDAEAGVCY